MDRSTTIDAAPVQMWSRRHWRVAAAAAILLAAILVPFVLLGTRPEDWTTAVIDAAAAHRGLVFIAIVVLLVVDIALPIPSSLVSTTGGLLLGFAGGLAASTAGMTLGAVVAYGLGRSSAGAARRLIGPEDLARVSAAFERYGDWLIVVSRSVPVLAEATPLVAGMAGMPRRRFVVFAGLASAGVAAAYSLLGASAAGPTSFLLVFAASLVVPLGPLLWVRRIARTRFSGRARGSADDGLR